MVMVVVAAAVAQVVAVVIALLLLTYDQVAQYGGPGPRQAPYRIPRKLEKEVVDGGHCCYSK